MDTKVPANLSAERRKPRILLNWWYNREDLLSPFLQLKEDFDFILIFHVRPPDNEVSLPFPIRYWSDYLTPNQLLKDLRPDKVVFFSVDDGPYQISLNIVCRAEGIPTAVCDHGLRSEQARVEWDETSVAEIRRIRRTLYGNFRIRPAIFLFSCVRLGTLQHVPLLLKFFWLKAAGAFLIPRNASLRMLREVDCYIVYGEENGNYFKQRDDIQERKIRTIGHPFFDRFFSLAARNQPSQEAYFLLIDQPLEYIGLANEKPSFLNKLHRYSRKHGAKLYIKLHPADYDRENSLNTDDVRYFRGESDVFELIINSQGVFGLTSTLLLVAMLVKKCCVFKTGDNTLERAGAALGVARILDFHHFTDKDIDFERFEPNEMGREEFARKFLYRTDGKSLERLRLALHEF